MPRPGPRPYECVRRAWHSDRHQPIRGSLIKEIFRVANGIHSSATKKNKEWQEKLPIVVLKAEEIMYSKANSEAEYMDLKTLWDRTNDAINTIIRLDESTETGEFLQPCIEAALNLGCTPRRASRSQRSNPRCYLSTSTSEVPSGSPNMVENVAHGDYRINSLYMSDGSSFVKSTTMNPTHLSSGTGIPVVENSDCSGIKLTYASENVPPKYDQLVATENYAVSNSFSAYPLYFGNCHQFGELQLGLGVLPKSVSNPLEPAEGGIVTNLFCDKDASKKKHAQTNETDGLENPCTTGCDLSLRLGPFSLPPCPDVGNNRSQDVKDGGFQEGIKFNHQSSELDKNFPSFPRANPYVPLGSCSSRWNLEGGCMTVEEKMRKRKAGLDNPMEDQQFCLQPKLRFSHLTGSMRNAGL